MARPKRILIAVDGSQHAFQAVHYVASHWSPSTLKVNLLCVVPSVPEVFKDLEAQVYFKQTFKNKYSQWKRDMKNVAQGFLERARAILVDADIPESQVGLILQEEEVGVARDIIAEAKRGYDAVVLSRKGLSKVEEGFFLGSVCTKIVSAIKDVPVWVVGGTIESNKVLLAVDASENSRKALDYVGSFAKNTTAQICLYHVVRHVSLAFGTNLLPRNEQREHRWQAKIAQDAEGMLKAYMERLEKVGVPASRVTTKCRLESSSRSADILQEARAGNYGTVVLGRRGLSRVRQFVVGRVTSKVLSQADELAVWLVG